MNKEVKKVLEGDGLVSNRFSDVSCSCPFTIPLLQAIYYAQDFAQNF